MSSETNDLFEGLQIMSPEELQAAVKSNEDSGEPEGGQGEKKEIEGVEELFKPVVTETGESGTEGEEKSLPTTKTETSESQNKNEVVYKALMKELVNAGVLTVEEMEKLDEMPGTLDSIKELVNKTVETNFNAKQETWKKGLSPEKKRFLEIEDAFDETDQAIMMAQRLEFFENVSQDDVKGNEKLQQQIYYDQLIAKNFTHEQAVEAIEDAMAVNKLEDKALKAIPELKEQAKGVVEQAKASKEAKTKAEVEAQNKAFKDLLDNIEARNSFIDGLNLNKISKDKLKNNIMNPVYTDPKSGREYNSLMYKQQRNPVEFEMLINYYDTLGLFNLDKDGKFKPDISKLKTVAKTAAITELDRVISAEDERGVGRNTSVETSQKTGSILDLLEKAVNKK
jgi:hypothetical protein